MDSQMVPQWRRLAGLQLAVLGLVGLFPVELGWRGVDSHEGLGMLPDRAVTTELGGGGEWQGMKQSGGGTEQNFGSSSANRGISILVSSCREKRLCLGLYCNGVGWQEEQQWQQSGCTKANNWKQKKVSPTHILYTVLFIPASACKFY